MLLSAAASVCGRVTAETITCRALDTVDACTTQTHASVQSARMHALHTTMQLGLLQQCMRSR